MKTLQFIFIAFCATLFYACKNETYSHAIIGHIEKIKSERSISCDCLLQEDCRGKIDELALKKYAICRTEQSMKSLITYSAMANRNFTYIDVAFNPLIDSLNKVGPEDWDAFHGFAYTMELLCKRYEIDIIREIGDLNFYESLGEHRHPIILQIGHLGLMYNVDCSCLRDPKCNTALTDSELKNYVLCNLKESVLSLLTYYEQKRQPYPESLLNEIRSVLDSFIHDETPEEEFIKKINLINQTIRQSIGY